MYTLKFDDGEFIGNFDNLDKLQDKMNYIFSHYISRYAIPYKDGKRISISEERKKLESNSRKSNSIDWSKLKNIDLELNDDPGIYLVLKSPERFAKNVEDALKSGKSLDYDVFKGITDDIAGFVDVHKYLEDLDAGKFASESIFFDEVDHACGDDLLMDYMADNGMLIPVGNYQVTGITTLAELEKFNKAYPLYAAKLETAPRDIKFNSNIITINSNTNKMKKVRIKSRNYNSRRHGFRKFNSVVDLVGQEVEITEDNEVIEGTVESVEVNKDEEVTVELDGGDKVVLEPTEAAELIDKGEVVTEEVLENPVPPMEPESNCNEYKIARNCTYKNGKKCRKVASVTAPTLEEAIAAVETKDKADDIEAEGYEELVEQLPEDSTVVINSDIEEEIMVEPENPEVVEETTPETPMEPEVVEETTPETPMEPEVVEEEEDRQSNSFVGVSEYLKRAYGIDLNKDKN